MRLARALEDKKFDVRLRDQKVDEGILKKDEILAYEKQLVDDEENADYMDVEDR
jgi:hypothetical protein